VLPHLRRKQAPDGISRQAGRKNEKPLPPMHGRSHNRILWAGKQAVHHMRTPDEQLSLRRMLEKNPCKKLLASIGF